MGRNRKTDRHLPNKMYLRCGTYYFVDSKGKWSGLGKTFVEAMREYANLIEGIGNILTIGQLIDRYLVEVAPLKAKETYKSNLNEAKFLRIGLGEMRVGDLKSWHVYQYMDIRKKRGTVRPNREVALLSHIYTTATRWGLVENNPCLKVERFKEAPRERYIEDWEYGAFRNFAGPVVAAYMDFKLLTGLRISDVLKVKIEDLKVDGIHVLISKTKRNIIIEWSERLRKSVEKARSLNRSLSSEYLFSTRNGKQYTCSGFSSTWQRKMKKALELGIIKERFRDHDLRAKTGSDIEFEHATRLLAHLDSKITEKHYRRRVSIVRPLG